MSTTRFDNVPVACADCPKCGKENVVGRISAARSGFNSTKERQITCKRCDEQFTTTESRLVVRRHPREEIDAEYGVESLEWVL
jgi:hypothetical protein